MQIDNGRALLAPFESVFRYWPFSEIPENVDGEPAITVRPDGDGYRLHADWRPEPPRYSNPVNLACGLAVNVNRAFLQENQSYLCLHGAGVVIGGRLVVLPNYYRAGKSALTVCLAAAGARVFSDDILPLLPDGAGMALGISPRLRLPLPEGLGARTLDFIAHRRGAANKQYLYVELGPHEQAPLGATARFGGFVLLDRRESGKASLSPASEGEILKQVVLRNFARQIPAEASLDRLHGLVAGSACHRLTYANGDDAADLLMERFSSIDPAPAEPLRTAETAEIAPLPQSSPTGGDHPRRNPDIAERAVDRDLFLVDGSGETIYHLNPVAAGLWRLMDGSCGTGDAVMLLQLAFPQVERAEIARDVESVVADLLKRGLLLRGRESARDIQA